LEAIVMYHFRALTLTLAISAAFVAKATANETEVRAALAAYVESFNKQDVAAVAAAWTDQSTHTDRETGERTEGREAIQADIATSFKEQPNAVLAGRVDRVRMIKPDVASVEGETTFGVAGEDPIVNNFTAIVVKQGDKWLIDSIEEMPLPTPTTPTEALRDLEWMIGSWLDDGGETRVTTQVRWTASNAFLLRSFTVESADGTQQGTQIIGWDPRSQEIRSWSFNSDGSFGDGIWTKSGEDWLIKSSQTLADGRAASGTYLLKRVDDNTITLELVGHEIDGEPQAAKEAVKVVRAATTPAAPATKPAK
jgi:uncharacterized protein (TIGR02246 family)